MRWFGKGWPIWLLLLAVISAGLVIWSQQMQLAPDVPPKDAPPAAANQDPVASPDLRQVQPYAYLDLLPEGRKAPELNATSAQGEPVSLEHYQGQPVVLVFYQGHFCPVCARQLANLQANLDEFEKHKAQIIAISADTAELARQTVAEQGLGFPVVPDADKAIIKRYGVSNVIRDGIAYPTVYVLDAQHQVKKALADESGKRYQTEDILPLL